MPLNIIDKNMIVKNKIELKPIVSFVSASLDCNNLNLLELESPGVFGELKAKSINANKWNLEYPRTFKVKDISLDVLSEKNVNILNDSKFNNPPFNILNNLQDYEASLESKGFFFDRSGEYKFGVDRIQQKYLVEDNAYNKKKSIKNLYKFYRENIEYRQHNLNWGFSNYNTLNFFNVSENLNDDLFKDLKNKTHSNCLAYPNLVYTENGVQKKVYDFKTEQNGGLTFSFYINQRRKNKSDYHFNPGCILHIPHIIGIYIVKGSSTDINGLTDKYRFYIETGNGTLGNFDRNDFLKNNINSYDKYYIAGNSSDERNSYLLTSDNIVEYNKWHNICISFVKKPEGTEKYDLELYVDGIIKDFFTNISVEFNKQVDQDDNVITDAGENSNTFITVGNRFQNISDSSENLENSNNLGNIFNKLFSINKSENDDKLGPYVKKHIDFGTDITNISEVPVEIHDDAISHDFKNTLVGPLSFGGSANYVGPNTSLALNAELHDIRIYNRHIQNVEELICKKSIEDFNDENLIFSVPCFYYESDIKRKGLVNLNGLSSNSNNRNEINDDNLLIDGPVNSYFSNKCLGHEVSVENFIVEFKKKVSPNFIINNSFSDDSSFRDAWNIIACDSNFSDADDIVNIRVKKGFSVNDVYFEKISTNNSLDQQDEQSFYFSSNINYKNNFILPNDNGLQEQKYNEFKNYYENYSGIFHINENDYFDLGFVNLNNVHSENIALIPIQSIQSISGNSFLIEKSETLGFPVDLEDRDNFLLDFLEGTQETFKESYNLFKNTSLNNFFKSTFVLDETYDNFRMLKINKTITSGMSSSFTVGREDFFNDYSNPLGRKIHDDYLSGVGNTLPPISEKQLDNSQPTPDTVGYYKHELPIFNITKDRSENYSVIFDISSQLFRRKIERETLEIKDVDLQGSGGSLQVTLKDNGLGCLYRADCLTKQATWNFVGHCLYGEGLITLLHPGLENFGKSNFGINFKCATSLNVMELNLPAHAGKTNLSRNLSYNEDLRLDDSAFNSDEKFVYITDIHLHDHDLNILATAKLAKPFPKKSLDNVLFRLKMDF